MFHYFCSISDVDAFKACVIILLAKTCTWVKKPRVERI